MTTWLLAGVVLLAQEQPAIVPAAATSAQLNSPIAEATDWSVQLRVAWGGGTEQLWQGEILVNQGAVQFVRSLGIEADEPGTMFIDQGRLVMRGRSLRAYDGVDLRVPYDPAIRLTIRLTNQAGVKFEEVVTLDELLHKSWQKNLDEQGNRLFVRRLPSDQLRLQTARDHLVFAPREVWSFEVTPHLLPISEGTQTRIKARLVNKSNGQEPWQQEFLIAQWSRDWSHPATLGAKQPSIPFQLTWPDNEGVYELILEAHERGPLRWGKVVQSRTVQTLVIAERAPRPTELNQTWQKVFELDPTNNSWMEKLRSSWSLWPGARPGPLNNGLTSVQQLPGLTGAVMQLSADRVQGDPAWDAYPLVINKPGMPHLLEVEYPQHLEQALGISIVEPNAAGQVQPLGLDSGVHVTSDQTRLSPGWARHKIVFWPRTKLPLVLLTNRSANGPAWHGKLRVLAGPTQLPPQNFTRLLPAQERLFGAAWLRPMFAEQLGANKAVDAWSGRALDDWQTFYEGATRVVEYSRYAGYNTVLLSAWADGSSLYPSQLLQPTPRYDTGMFFDVGNDPVRKDVLEACARVCDRQGLKLMLGLQFAAPLSELEAQLRQPNADHTGILLIGRQGLPWSAVNPQRRGTAPIYNPLDERVQVAIARVITELATRYAKHPAFAGIQLELGADCYLQFPGEDWGLDDRTFARFAQAKQLTQQFSGPDRHAQRAQLIANDAALRQAWLNWRAEQLQLFHTQLQSQVLSIRSDAKLLLTPTNCYDLGQLQAEIQPRVLATNPNSVDVGQQLAWLAQRTEFATTKSNWLTGTAIAAPGELARQQLLLGWQESRAGKLHNGQQPGTMFYHEPQRLRLPSFDQVSPFGKEKTFTWQITQFAPSEFANRQRFAQALATQDQLVLIDGGYSPPIGQESALSEWLATYRQLPTEKFATVTLTQSSEPVVIRRLLHENQTWIYAVNTAPWPVQINFNLPANAASQVIEVTGQGPQPIIQGTTQLWTLQPYALLALRVPGSVELEQTTIIFPQDLGQQLLTRLAQIRQRRALLENPPTWNKLVNGDFEQAVTTGQIPGWQVQPVDANASRWQLLNSATQSGNQALQLSNTTATKLVLQSDAVEVPTTGRLALSVWVRNLAEATQPSVRLELSGVLQEQPYVRYATIGGQPATTPLRTEWSQYILQVDDLPVTGLRQLVVRVELQGVGSVALDAVQLYALQFSESERRQLDKSLALAEFQLQNGQLGQCWQDLQGYWPRYLLSQIPAQQLPIAPQPVVEQPVLPRPVERQAVKPGMWDRVRDFWRF